MKPWQPDSWRNYPIHQQPIYTDAAHLTSVLEELATQPGLVTRESIVVLSQLLQEVCFGQRFLLQGGDCAESFDHLSLEHMHAYTALMEDMASILEYGIRMPVTIVGRVAGQYAKPRTHSTETRGGVTLPSYRGDMINSFVFDADARRADPKRLSLAYDHAKHTLHYLNLAASNHAFYCSHEGLLLPFEEALVRKEEDGTYYASSAHMLWIGNRTLGLHEAHLEFMRGLLNPIAIKVGPSLLPSTLTAILDILNPHRIPGRVSCVVRHGVEHIRHSLPPLLEAVVESGHPVIWVSDPMHGNTSLLSNSMKVRHFDTIFQEFHIFCQLLRAFNLPIGGIHLELTAMDVAECIGGSHGVNLRDLEKNYQSYCDPRLNLQQSLEFAELMVQEIRP